VILLKTIPKKYDITQCALYKCRNKKRLEHLLCLERGKLHLVQDAISYHSFQIDKKHSAEKRDITAPDRTLKQLQSRILKLIQGIRRPEWLISGEKGKCYIDNGKAHLSGKYVLTIDIRKFYDNCKRNPVYNFFKGTLCTSPDVAKILTDIVTYKGGIPTGCPTSQLIAFYAYQKMFMKIDAIALKYGCIFTLYVDDMTFSSDQPFSPRALSWDIDKILRQYGHRPKYKKVRYFSMDEAKPITGTIVTSDHRLDVPNSLQEKIYENFQSVKHLRKSFQLDVDDIKKLQTLKGQIQAARNIDSCRFPEITRLTQQIHVPELKTNGIKEQKFVRVPKKIRITEQKKR
jgi:RNA-directed DNA polymerase